MSIDIHQTLYDATSIKLSINYINQGIRVLR